VTASRDPDSCYRALLSRDRRFDGLFFVGVRTTGVYCRPICPARAPGRDRCEFFGNAAEAERAGFRACFRCRPELAPGLAPVDAVPRLVRAAAARVQAGFLDEGTVDDLARALGVTARHLRRAMEAELGVSPVELAQTRRLALAKQLLHDTNLPLTDVAFAAGFSSLRRFNALFQTRFGRAPSAVRRALGERTAAQSPGPTRPAARSSGVARRATSTAPRPATSAAADITLRLDYRPPFDAPTLFGFLAARAVPGVEQVAAGQLVRTVRMGDVAGWLAVAPDRDRPALRARVSLSLVPRLAEIVARLRALFDLDAQPDVIAAALGADPRLGPLVRARPGLRVPGAFDPFEAATRTVLGQLVSVRAATTLAGRLARTFGAPAPADVPGLDRLFPTAAELARVPVGRLAAIGLPAARARTILGLARAVAHGRLDLGPARDPEAVVRALLEMPGIGPWTAQAIALRVLRFPDAFPSGDLGVQQALGTRSAREAEALSAPWRPFRAYAVLHLWTAHSLSKGG